MVRHMRSIERTMAKLLPIDDERTNIGAMKASSKISNLRTTPLTNFPGFFGTRCQTRDGHHCNVADAWCVAYHGSKITPGLFLALRSGSCTTASLPRPYSPSRSSSAAAGELAAAGGSGRARQRSRAWQRRSRQVFVAFWQRQSVDGSVLTAILRQTYSATDHSIYLTPPVGYASMIAR